MYGSEMHHRSVVTNADIAASQTIDQASVRRSSKHCYDSHGVHSTPNRRRTDDGRGTPVSIRC